MSTCTQYAAAFGYQVYIVPVKDCAVDLGSVNGGIGPGGFIDPTELLPQASQIVEGATAAEILAGDPGVNIIFDNDVVAEETVIRLYGLTNAGLETDTGSETITTYDSASRGFDQNVAVSKSWTLSLEGVSQFTDAGYKILRLMEANAVAGQLKVKIGRVGPVGTSEAIYGYATLSGFSESVEAGSIVGWSLTAEGYGPYGLDLDNTGSINLVGPITAISLASGGSGYANGTFTAKAVTGGSGSGGTVNVTVSGNAVTSATLVSAGDGYAIGNTLGVSELSAAIDLGTYAILTGSIFASGSNYADGTYTSEPLTGGSGADATATITVLGGAVTSVVLTDGGSGYAVDNSLSAALDPAPNPNYQGVSLASLTTGGSNLANGTYTSEPATGGTGTGASFDLTVSGNTVTSITRVDKGSGYTVNDVLSFSLDAAANPDLGEILSLDALSLVGGSGYVDGTYTGVSLTGGTGTGATADIVVASGSVSSVTLVSGGTDYLASDTLSATDASLGDSTNGSGFAIDVDTIDSSQYLTATQPTITVITVDASQNLTPTSFTYKVNSVDADQAMTTTPVQITVTNIAANE